MKQFVLLILAWLVGLSVFYQVVRFVFPPEPHLQYGENWEPDPLGF